MKTLTKKLCQIMGELNGVQKTGFNDFQKYEYVTESDLANLVRPLLAKYGIFIFPKATEITTTNFTRNDKSYVSTMVKVEYKIVDSETGEQETVTFYGTGEDQQDKGVYKAMTGAHKYMLLKTFNLGTEDDPEKDEEPKPKMVEFKDFPKTETTPRKETGVITPKQAGLLLTKAKQSGWTEANIIDFFEHTFQVKGIPQLPFNKMQDALRLVSMPFLQASAETGCVPF